MAGGGPGDAADDAHAAAVAHVPDRDGDGDRNNAADPDGDRNGYHAT
ncbi:MAG: hypothetical protein HXY29_14660, partial [Rhodocyclaceae bacterium]|nr:hypothetical protein [Rhodocyclaceae bacterium]